MIEAKSLRGTGRTYRMLQQVAEAAKTTPLRMVVVVVNSDPFVDYAIRLLGTIANVDPGHPRECRIGDCLVRFYVYSPDLKHRLAGLSKDIPQFCDHAVRT